MKFNSFVDQVLCEQIVRQRKFNEQMAQQQVEIRKLEEKLFADNLVRLIAKHSAPAPTKLEDFSF